MELLYVKPQDVDKAWRDGAIHLSEACDRAKREITGDQLKMILARGERDLFCLFDGEIKGWIVVQAQQLPNVRVMYVYSLYAPGFSLDMYSLLEKLAIQAGCSVIRGSVDEANERLWRRVKAEKVYSVYEIEVKS